MQQDRQDIVSATLTAPRLPRRVRLVLSFGMALVLLLTGVIGWSLYEGRQAARHQAELEGREVLLAIGQNITRMFDTLDLSLQATTKGMNVPGISEMPELLRQAILFDGAAAAPGLGGIYVIGTDGLLIYSSTEEGPWGVDLHDRRYFQVLRDDPGTGLYMEKPLRGARSGLWTIVVGRRISRPDGSFGGVVLGTIRLDFLRQMFEQVQIRKDDTFSLSGPDNERILRVPFSETDIGRTMHVMPPTSMSAATDFQTLQTSASGDKPERLYVFHRIADYPLQLRIGITTRNVYAQWENQAELRLGTSVAAILIGAALGTLLLREFRGRQLAEAQARASEEEVAEAFARLDTLFRSSPESMLIAHVDPSGSFTYQAVNPVWEKLTGIRAQAALGRTPQQILPASAMPPFLHAWGKCVAERRQQNYQFSYPPGLSSSDWEGVVAPVIGRDGRVQQIVVISRDVTERNRVEAGLRQTLRLQAIGQLTGGIAHDFNNLLQAIYSATELLKEKFAIDGEPGDLVDVIVRSADHGAALVRSLMSFSRQQALAPIVLNPREVLDDVKDLLAHAVSGRVKLVVENDPDDGLVRVDRAELQASILNLVLNARDVSSADATVILRTIARDAAAAESAGLPAGDYVCIEVKDEGSGMPAEVMQRAFEPFFTTKPIGKAPGLGLSMVYGFAQQSGGDVRIDSRPEQGTRVTIWLPRIASSAPQTQPSATPHPSPSSTTGHVLIVDDQPAILRTLSAVLRRAGFTPATAEIGEEALTRLRDGAPCDLLVTDLSMPGMSGTELINQVSLLRPDLPCILMSGFDVTDTLDQCPAHVTLLRKPFSSDALLHEVRALLAATP